MTVRKEHDFLVEPDVWERAVFDAAVMEGWFTTYNAATRAKGEYATFPEAMLVAHTEPRTMLYAVAKSGRFTMLPQKAWNDCARRYLELKGIPIIKQ